MRLFIVISAFVCMHFAGIKPAFAGFEWVPPTESPAPTVRHSSAIPAPAPIPALAPAPVPVTPGLSPVPAVPVAPVTAVPSSPAPRQQLGGSLTPYPQPRLPGYTPKPMTVTPSAVPPPGVMASPRPVPATPMAVPSTIARPVTPMAVPSPVARPMPAPVTVPKKTALYINPYPLKNGGVPSAMVPAPASHAINQSLAEHGGVLHPLPLGDGQNTGAKPYRRSDFPSFAMKSPVQEPMPVSHMPPPMPAKSVTPMMGGEPAPLSTMHTGGTFYNNPHSTRAVMAPGGHNNNYTFSHAVGFGRNIPLSLALSQIVPSEFSRQISPSVNQDMNVSWNGGKPWNQVLSDMLREQNMTAEVHGNTVVIR